MKLETIIARLLGVGTAIACALMTVGLVTGATRVVVAGIACLIALPMLRVAVLVVAFARSRELPLAAAGIAVLAIVALGVTVFC
jgi:uncharacterized membrane protein